MSIIVILPIRTVSEMNATGKRRDIWRRAKSQRATAKLYTLVALKRTNPFVAGPLHVHLTRIIGKHGKRFDYDGLVASNKHVVDGVMDAIGRNDGDRSISWLYDDDRAVDGKFAVRVEISSKPVQASVQAGEE